MTKRFHLHTTVMLFAAVAAAAFAGPSKAQLELEPEDHIVVVGNTFAERMAQSGYFDSVVHAAYPDAKILIRHAPNSADEVDERPREHSVPNMEANLDRYDADVVVMCFGMSESFDGLAKLNKFGEDLAKQIDAFKASKFNGESAPRLVLISPIAHEDLGEPYPTGAAIQARNRTLQAYSEKMKQVAQDKGIIFVDLFTPSTNLYANSDANLTSNGIHPNELGTFHFTKEIAKQLGMLKGEAGDSENADKLRWLAWDKHYHFRHLYRATNTEYVWGRRNKPFGLVSFPPEQEQLEKMIAAREAAMWELHKPSPAGVFANEPSGTAIWMKSPTSSDFAVDKWEAPEVAQKGSETSVGDLEIADPEQALDTFTVADGYKVDIFASEKDFEELANPLAMAFDYKGRLWVLCAPTYPHPMPGEQPDCKLIILEDTNKDGKADKRTVFARHLNIPTGFAIDTDAVYIGQAPDLFKFVDTDGDDVADYSEIVHSGFGMPDSHHTISSFTWDPNGGFTMNEGVFMRTNIETPWGTKRTRDGAVWRFDPAEERLLPISHTSHPNPWGMAYDIYGQSIYMDTSGPNHYNFSHLIAAFEYPEKAKKGPSMLSRGRPVSGNEIIYSRHLPDNAQGTHLTNLCIGFHGTRWDRLMSDGTKHSGYTSEPMPQDFLSSTDTNFRPVDVEVAPDGSIYVLDWCNPLIGHMQYSIRDARRDHSHGRVWRVTYPERPLVETPDLTTLSIEQLLEQLMVPERNTRQRARRVLQKSDPEKVKPALKKWIDEANPRDPSFDMILLQALWVTQGMGEVDLALLDETLRSRTPQVKAAAIRVLRYWLQWDQVKTDDAQRFIAMNVVDGDMRVRLEAVVAAGFLKSKQAVNLVELAASMPMDGGLRAMVEQTLKHLAQQDFGADDGISRLFMLKDVPAEELAGMDLDKQVATVTLARSDTAIQTRREALTFLAGNDPPGQAEVLRALIQDDFFDADSVGESLTPVVVELPRATIEEMRSDFELLSESAAPALRQLAVTGLLRSGEPVATLAAQDATALVSAINYFQANQLPADAVDTLKSLVADGKIDAANGIEQVIRISPNPKADFPWLARFVDTAAEITFQRWGREHLLAMAALQGMHQVDRQDWPAGYDQYQFEPVSEAFFELGRELYHEPEIGCGKCHGDNGEGKESYPPLANSPWAVGDPQRAAAIVVHGLSGPLEVYPGGPKYNAQMEALNHFSDGEVAAMLTYIRQSFGNYAPPVKPTDVTYARNNVTPDGTTSWDPAALLGKFPFERDRVLGTDRQPNELKPVFQLPASGMVQMFAVVFVVMLLILLATYFGGRGGGQQSSTTHSPVPA